MGQGPIMRLELLKYLEIDFDIFDNFPVSYFGFEPFEPPNFTHANYALFDSRNTLNDYRDRLGIFNEAFRHWHQQVVPFNLVPTYYMPYDSRHTIPSDTNSTSAIERTIHSYLEYDGDYDEIVGYVPDLAGCYPYMDIFYGVYMNPDVFSVLHKNSASDASTRIVADYFNQNNLFLFDMNFFNMFHMRVWPRPVHYYYSPTVSAPNPAYDVVDTIAYAEVEQNANKAKYVVDKSYQEDFFLLVYVRLREENATLHVEDIFVWPDNKANVFIDVQQNFIDVYIASKYNIITPIVPRKKKYNTTRTDVPSIIRNLSNSGKMASDIFLDIISMKVINDDIVDEYTFLDHPHPIESGIMQGSAGWEISEAILVTNNKTCVDFLYDSGNGNQQITNVEIVNNIGKKDFIFYENNDYTVMLDNNFEQPDTNVGWSEGLYVKFSLDKDVITTLQDKEKYGLIKNFKNVFVNGRNYVLTSISDLHQVVEFRNYPQELQEKVRNETEQYFILSHENDKRNSKYIYGVINDHFYGSFSRVSTTDMIFRQRFVLVDDEYAPTESTSFIERKTHVYKNDIQNISRTAGFYDNLNVFNIGISSSSSDDIFSRIETPLNYTFNTQNTGVIRRSQINSAQQDVYISIMPDLEDIYNVEIGEAHDGNDLLFLSNTGDILDSDYVLLLYTPTVTHTGVAALSGFYFLNNTLALKSKLWNVHNIGYYNEFYNKQKIYRVKSDKYAVNAGGDLFTEIPDSVLTPFYSPLASILPADAKHNFPSFFTRIFSPRIPVFLSQKFLLDELKGFALRQIDSMDNELILRRHTFMNQSKYGYYDVAIKSVPRVTNDIIANRSFAYEGRIYGVMPFPFSRIAEVDEYNPFVFLAYFTNEDSKAYMPGTDFLFEKPIFKNDISFRTYKIVNGNYTSDNNDVFTQAAYFATDMNNKNLILDHFNRKKLRLTEITYNNKYYRLLDLSRSDNPVYVLGGYFHNQSFYVNNRVYLSGQQFRHNRVNRSYEESNITTRNNTGTFFDFPNAGLAEIASYSGVWCSLLYSNYVPPIPRFLPNSVDTNAKPDVYTANLPQFGITNWPTGFTNNIHTSHSLNFLKYNNNVAFFAQNAGLNIKRLLDRSRIRNGLVIYGAPGTWCHPIGASSYIQGYFTRVLHSDGGEMSYAILNMPIEMIEPIDNTLKFKNTPTLDKSFVNALARLNNIYVGSQKFYQMSPSFNGYVYVFMPYDKARMGIGSINYFFAFAFEYLQVLKIPIFSNSTKYRFMLKNHNNARVPSGDPISFEAAVIESLSLPQIEHLHGLFRNFGVVMRPINHRANNLLKIAPFYIWSFSDDIRGLLNSNNNKLVVDRDFFYTYSTYSANRWLGGRSYYGMPFFGRSLEGNLENLFFVYNELEALRRNGYYRKYDKKIRRVKTGFNPFTRVSVGITFMGSNATFAYYVGEAGGIIGYNLSNRLDKRAGHDLLPYYKILRKPDDVYWYYRIDNFINNVNTQPRDFVLSFYSQPYLSVFSGLDAIPDLNQYEVVNPHRDDPITPYTIYRLMKSPYTYLGQMELENTTYSCFSTAENMLSMIALTYQRGSNNYNDIVDFFNVYFNYGLNTNSTHHVFRTSFKYQIDEQNIIKVFDMNNFGSLFTRRNRYISKFKTIYDRLHDIGSSSPDIGSSSEGILYYFIVRYCTVHAQENIEFNYHYYDTPYIIDTYNTYNVSDETSLTFNIARIAMKPTFYTRRFFTSSFGKEYNSIENTSFYKYTTYHLYLNTDLFDEEVYQKEHKLGGLHLINFFHDLRDASCLPYSVDQLVFWFHNPDGYFFYHKPEYNVLEDVKELTVEDIQGSNSNPKKIYTSAYYFDRFFISTSNNMTNVDDLFNYEKQNYLNYYIIPSNVISNLDLVNSLIAVPVIYQANINDDNSQKNFSANMYLDLFYNYAPKPTKLDNSGYILEYNLSAKVKVNNNQVVSYPVPWRHFLYTSYVLYPYIQTWDFTTALTRYFFYQAGNTTYPNLNRSRVFIAVRAPVYYSILPHKTLMIHGKYPASEAVFRTYKPEFQVGNDVYPHTNCRSFPPTIYGAALNSPLYVRTLFAFSLTKSNMRIFWPHKKRRDLTNQSSPIYWFLQYPQHENFRVETGIIARKVNTTISANDPPVHTIIANSHGDPYNTLRTWAIITSQSDLKKHGSSPCQSNAICAEEGGWGGSVHIELQYRDNIPAVGKGSFYYFERHKRQLTGMVSIINSIDYLGQEYGAPVPDRQLLHTHGGFPYYEALILDFILSSGFFMEVEENNTTVLQGFALPHPNYIIGGDYDIYKAKTPSGDNVYVPEPVYTCPPMSFVTSLYLNVRQKNNNQTKTIKYNFFKNNNIGFRSERNNYASQPKYYWEDLFANTCFPQCAWPVMNKRLNKYDYMTQQTYGNWNGGVYSGFSEIYKIDIQEVRQSVVQQGGIQGDN